MVLCGVLGLDGMDIASMGPALPNIEQDLDMSATALQWVVSAYVLGYGGFLLLGGRLADLLPRRRLLIGALLVFAVASFVGGLAESGPVLIAARLVKGISAAFTAPAALVILLATYREEAARNRALGAFIAMGAAGFTTGLALGGALSNVTWRLTLFLPTAVALAIAVGAQRLVPGDQTRPAGRRGRVDVLGAAAVTDSLLLLVFGVSHASTSDWTDAWTLGSLGASFVILALFVWVERITPAPLVPLEIFSRPQLAHADACAMLFQGCYVGFQFVATLYFQEKLGWTPLQTGLAFPIGGRSCWVLSQRLAGFVTRFGSWPVATAGLALQVLAYLWFTQLDGISSLALVLVSQALLGLGYAATYPALNIAAVAHTRPDEQGLAGRDIHRLDTDRQRASPRDHGHRVRLERRHRPGWLPCRHVDCRGHDRHRFRHRRRGRRSRGRSSCSAVARPISGGFMSESRRVGIVGSGKIGATVARNSSHPAWSFRRLRLQGRS